MNKDFPGNRWLTAFVSFVILFNASACSASSQNTTHASTATAGAIATKVPATQTPTPEPTATPTETPTPEIALPADLKITTKFELSKMAQLPEITTDQAVSPEFDAYLTQQENAGKLGDFSQYVEPMSPKWGDPGSDFESKTRPIYLINVSTEKEGAYSLTNTRPFYNEIYFKTKLNGQDYLLWVQRWKNPDGSTSRVKYMYPFEKIYDSRIQGWASKEFGLVPGKEDSLRFLSPVLYPDNVNFATLYAYDKNYYDSYWKEHGADMIKFAQDLAKNDPTNIPQTFPQFIWSPGAAPVTGAY
ncbi:MAG: hypothetical protein M1485_05925 [Chloroflexi bacterium]|nr:hypothetical protein [Chloroflexota bacterium]